jgi:HEPN domain-containing protein
MKPLAQEWVDKAEGDHRAACALVQSADPVWDAICFHAQQCAEKYLKAWLTEQQASFPRTHDLDMLGKLSRPSLGGLEHLADGLRLLTSFGTEVRYPGIEARQDDAHTCLAVSCGVRQLVRQALALRESG